MEQHNTRYELVFETYTLPTYKVNLYDIISLYKQKKRQKAATKGDKLTVLLGAEWRFAQAPGTSLRLGNQYHDGKGDMLGAVA